MSLELPKVYAVASHTDNVGPGSTFVAIPGSCDDGNSYIYLAVEKGATKIVVQKNVELSRELNILLQDKNIALDVVDDCRLALPQLVAESLGYPAKKLKLIGITGTKGKTSTAYMIYHLLQKQGLKVGLLSTAEKIIDTQTVSMKLTTPLPDHLHMFFHMCVERNVEYVVMEVSAQSLSLHRVAGIEFEAGIFTNFSLEHLEFYDSMQDYFEAKVSFFKYIKEPKNIFINFDDPYGKKILENNPEYSSYSLENKKSTWYACSHFKEKGVALHINKGESRYYCKANLFGKFNAYNLLVAVAIASSLGCSMESIEQATLSLEQIPGRMEHYSFKNGATCFIDYAHNPSSFEAVLSTLRLMTHYLIVVFGAGGSRDRSKRPIMGSIVEKYCDLAIVTSDNPRDESPGAIADDIAMGFEGNKELKILRELNRTKAIEKAYELSKKGAVIAILGKGRDEYQIVGDLTFPFKERAIIKPFLLDDNLYKSL